jgi:5'-3' exonuclease
VTVTVHLVDGTYELFRHFYAVPSRLDDRGVELGAARAVAGSLLRLLEEGATHVGVATDHVIESFRNDLWPGYKTSAGVGPALLGQFGPLEDLLAALGFVVWPMTDLEADDALAAAAAVADADRGVAEVLILTPDKDLAQCVRGHRVVQVDRRRGERRDEEGVRERFGVAPGSIPDWLALVGDSADGFPGLPGWGPKAASAVLGRYGRLDAVPPDPGDWEVSVRGARRLAATLVERRAEAELFRTLATLRLDAPVGEVPQWRWRGPGPEAAQWATRLGDAELVRRAEALAAARGG